ncbi:helix-turn-helix domain-containing protein [Alteribacillus sp. YIM 98480]|uniref:LexA family protein n=1 Tax=Alteribacillus sp. YIM 98480 TaxID=2606599 RepID=UPI00131BF1E4|nr:helix-turn-helix domain-containing protein [Alteribacillus sp. YIM 98480]
MTKRQREVYKVICDYMVDNNYPPTFRELQSLIGVKSVSTVYSFLKVLKRKGYVTWEESRPRTLRVLKRTA